MVVAVFDEREVARGKEGIDERTNEKKGGRPNS